MLITFWVAMNPICRKRYDAFLKGGLGSWKSRRNPSCTWSRNCPRKKIP